MLQALGAQNKKKIKKKTKNKKTFANINKIGVNMRKFALSLIFIPIFLFANEKYQSIKEMVEFHYQESKETFHFVENHRPKNSDDDEIFYQSADYYRGQTEAYLNMKNFMNFLDYLEQLDDLEK